MNDMKKDQRLSGNGKNGHAVKNGVAAHSLGSASDAKVDGQARELIKLILSLTRQMLVIDDATAELPLRQLRVCMSLFEGPKSMSALGRELGVSLSAMTQIADR